MSRITRFEAENVKIIKVVKIEPDGSIVRICGKNGQGKSTVLDSVQYVLGGANALPPKPLRKGQKRGHIEIHLDDPAVIVRRTFTEHGTSLTVESKDGAVYPSPQRILDALYGKLTFAPLEFLAKKPAEQFEMLLALIALKPDLERLEQLAPKSAIEEPILRLRAREKVEFESRTEKNREVKHVEGELAAIAEETDEDPKDSVNVADLVKKRDDLKAEVQRQANVRAGGEQLRGKAHERLVEAAELRAKADKLDAEGKAFNERARVVEAEVSEFTDQAPAIATHDDMIEEAQGVNERYAQVVRRREVKNRLDLAVAAAAGFTKKIDAIRAYRTELVAKAEMPIPGLGILEEYDDKGAPTGRGIVTYNGDPLEQISQAEQIRVSVAIAAALNPKLRVMLVREGSLLDKSSLALLAQLADEKDLQIWLEQVDESRKVGIVIEDGAVVAVNDAGDVETPAAADTNASGNLDG